MNTQNKGAGLREIPYNYTSFTDQDIIVRFLGQDMWSLIETLRGSRRTGRSAKMLFEVLGDIWVVSRNPYLQDDLLNNPKRRNALIQALHHRLNQFEKRINDNVGAETLLKASRQSVKQFAEQLESDIKLRQQIKARLSRITRSDNIDFSSIARVSHATDATDWRVEMPFVVIYPENEAEVAPLVKALTDLELTLIPRGGGTGYTGSAVPLDRLSAVINTEKLIGMSGIEYQTLSDSQSGSDPIVPIVNVECGVVTRWVSDLAKTEQLAFAVDPTSQDASTIGGNIAMNAGGKKAVLWGTTLDNLLSWKMVDPDGNWLNIKRLNHNLGKIHEQETVRFQIEKFQADCSTPIGEPQELSIPGSSFRKDRLGKDVTDKFLSGLPGVQKEGCDGLITSAQFILHRMPAHIRTVCLEFFDHEVRPAVESISEITQYVEQHPGLRLSGLEHLDDRYLKAIGYSTKAARQQLPKMVLIADLISDDAEALAEACSQVVRLANQKAGEGFIATSESARARFWLDRARTAAISAHTNAFKINEDVVIPLENLADYNAGIEKINIIQSVENKIDIVAGVLAELDKTAKQAPADCPEEHEFLQDKIRHISDILKQQEQHWQHLLSHLDQAAIEHAEMFDLDIKQLSETDTLLDLLMRKTLRISYRKAIVKQLDDTFSGKYFKDIRHKLRETHAKIRNERLFIALHMHAGDGNVHTNIPVHSQNQNMMQKADEMVDEIMDLAKKLDGVISGEHGIGLTKIRYLEQSKLQDFVQYKNQVDPQGHFNRGKLLPGSGLEAAYTPSMQLLEQEALILEDSELGALNDEIKHCLRCGKCKPVCMTHIPEANLLYSPRNKILATGLIIEAFLYEEQTRRGLSLHHFASMGSVADHCTVCHKCLNPCPVNIDFGDVTIKMRKILEDRGKGRNSGLSKIAMAFLNTTDAKLIRALRLPLMTWGLPALNLGHKILSKLHILDKPDKRPEGTYRHPSIPKKLINLVQKPVDVQVKGPTMRSLLGLEEKDQIPILRNPKASTESEAVFYFPGCGSERIYSDVGLATLTTLYELDVQTILPPGYLCCGYPQLATGLQQKGQQITTDNRVLFHRIANTLNYLDISTVLVSCGTCMDQLLKYEFEKIFPGCRILDIHEYLMEKKVQAKTQKTYLYHDPCHSPMKTYQPVQVAESLLQAKVVLSDRCCGEAGTLATSRPDISSQLRYRKESEIIKALDAHGLQGEETKLLTACPACQQGLSRYQANTQIKTDYIVVELVNQLYGPNWKERLIDHAMNGGVEKVLL